MKKQILLLSLVVVSLLIASGCSSLFRPSAGNSNSVGPSAGNSNSVIAKPEKKELKGVPADKVCAVFERSGIKSEYRAYKATPGSDFYGCSTIKILGKQGMLYAGTGNQTTVNEVTLSLTGLSKGTENTAVLKMLIAEGNEMSNTITGQPLSKEIEKSIIESTPGEWQLGDAKISLAKKETKIDSFDLNLNFKL